MLCCVALVHMCKLNSGGSTVRCNRKTSGLCCRIMLNASSTSWFAQTRNLLLKELPWPCRAHRFRWCGPPSELRSTGGANRTRCEVIGCIARLHQVPLLRSPSPQCPSRGQPANQQEWPPCFQGSSSPPRACQRSRSSSAHNHPEHLFPLFGQRSSPCRGP